MIHCYMMKQVRFAREQNRYVYRLIVLSIVSYTAQIIINGILQILKLTAFNSSTNQNDMIRKLFQQAQFDVITMNQLSILFITLLFLSRIKLAEIQLS